jgi:predicted amidohydrolase YtcJ
MNDAAMRAEALAAKDGRILAVGTAAEVMAHRGPGTEVIDLEGRALLPGFFDADGHGSRGGSTRAEMGPERTIGQLAGQHQGGDRRAA